MNAVTEPKNQPTVSTTEDSRKAGSIELSFEPVMCNKGVDNISRDL